MREHSLGLILCPHGVDFADKAFLSRFFGLFWLETDHVINVIDNVYRGELLQVVLLVFWLLCFHD